MAGRYKAYSDYQDSGVEWLDQVPNDWKMVKLSYGLRLQSGDTITSAKIKANGGFPVYGGNGTRGFTSTYNCDGQYVLIGRQGALCGNINLASGKFFASEHAVVVYPSKFWDTKYIAGMLLFMNLGQYSVSAAQPGVSVERLNMLKVIQPPLPEQKQIARFLDHETGKIDALIAKQQALIALLQEKRQAVISHAVTKGLNPEARMKDSGVEWLGDVPEHWEVKRLKFLCESIISGPFGSSITKDMYVRSGFKVYGQEQVIPNDFDIGDYYISEKNYLDLKRYAVAAGEVLISCVGTFGKIAVFPKNAEPGIINPRLMKALIQPSSDPQYVRELLKSEMVYKQFELLSRGGTMGVINISILNEILAAVPPKEEQVKIVKHIENKKTRFRKLIGHSQDAVQLLQERRTALISAAVTGKIDVRDFAPEAQEV